MAIPVPPDAVWFTLEMMMPDRSWRPVDHPDLGGRKAKINRYWRLDTTTPEAVAAEAAGDLPAVFRATWTRADRRDRIGKSPPFQHTPAPAVDEQAPASNAGEAAPAPRVAPPASEQRDPAGAHRAGAQAQPPPAASRAPQKAPLPGLNGNNGNGRGYVQPKIPMAFTAPPNDPDLSRFVFLHQLVQQQNDRFLTLVLTMMQTQAEAERTRSTTMLQSMREHYGSLAQGQERLNAALLAAQKGSETPIIMQQLAAQSTQNAQALALLGEKLEQFEEDDRQDALAALTKLSDNPNNVERVIAGVTNIVGALAQSPFGEAVGDALRARSQGAPQPPQGYAPAETADYQPPPPPQDNYVDDFPEGPPEQ